LVKVVRWRFLNRIKIKGIGSCYFNNPRTLTGIEGTERNSLETAGIHQPVSCPQIGEGGEEE